MFFASLPAITRSPFPRVTTWTKDHPLDVYISGRAISQCPCADSIACIPSFKTSFAGLVGHLLYRVIRLDSSLNSILLLLVTSQLNLLFLPTSASILFISPPRGPSLLVDLFFGILRYFPSFSLHSLRDRSDPCLSRSRMRNTEFIFFDSLTLTDGSAVLIANFSEL